ncbi:MAG: endolytic transglycosylase MltG, partial [Clostridiaceae bacterium]|nr:endolytic transglycosylase MltG [Clostridiaceae bacterium]
MKKIGLLIVVLIVCILFGVYKYKEIIQHPIKADKDIHVTVKSGDTLYSILNDLNQNGAIKNSTVLKLYIKINNIVSNVHSGRFLIPKDATVTELTTILSTGNDEDIVKVIIPEGYDINNIAKVLAEKGIISEEKFIESCKKYKLPTYIT